MEFDYKKSMSLIHISLVLVISLCALSLLCGCDPYYDQYPFLEEAEWICDEPHFTFTYTYDSNGACNGTELLTWQGTTMEVDVLFQSTWYVVIPEGPTSNDDRILTGVWRYQNGNLVLSIEEDFIFNNQYSELVFTRRK